MTLDGAIIAYLAHAKLKSSQLGTTLGGAVEKYMTNNEK